MKESKKLILLEFGSWLQGTGALLTGLMLFALLIFEGMNRSIATLLPAVIVLMEITGVLLITKAENMD